MNGPCNNLFQALGKGCLAGGDDAGFGRDATSKGERGRKNLHASQGMADKACLPITPPPCNLLQDLWYPGGGELSNKSGAGVSVCVLLYV